MTARAIDWQAHFRNVDQLVRDLREACIDWDGSQMSEHSEPRRTVTCGELRRAANEIERLRALLKECT